jgi:hypothetical protein
VLALRRRASVRNCRRSAATGMLVSCLPPLLRAVAGGTRALALRHCRGVSPVVASRHTLLLRAAMLQTTLQLRLALSESAHHARA